MTKARVNADNASADIQGVTAGTGLTGGGTSGTVTLTNDMATTIAAKGDLVVGTGNDTYAALTAGNSGETLVADSSTSTGLRYTAGNAQGNPIINSAFQIWQRGTSLVGQNSPTYIADRWATYRSAATFSRQSTGDTTNLPAIQYCIRAQRDSGGTGTGAIYVGQALETINSYQFAGKIVTLSFYARKGANYSSTSNALSVWLQTGTGIDQQVINNFTGALNPIDTTATLTDTWQRFSFTSTTLSSSMTQLKVLFFNTPVGTAGAADYFEITGVQLDIGSVALPFRTYSATLAGEFLACARYCFVAGGNSNYERFGVALPYSNTDGFIVSSLPAIMRTTPSFAVSAVGDWGVELPGVAALNLTAISIGNSSPSTVNLSYTTASNANFSSGKSAIFRASNTTNARLTFSAEL